MSKDRKIEFAPIRMKEADLTFILCRAFQVEDVRGWFRMSAPEVISQCSYEEE